MLLVEIDKTLNTLDEIKRLKETVADLQEKLEVIFTIEELQNDKGWVLSTDLYDFLKFNNSGDAFLRIETEKKYVTLLTVQFLAISYLLNEEEPDISDLKQLQDYLNKLNRFSGVISHWKDNSKFIVYQDYFNKKSWNEYALTTDGDWSNTHLLDESLPYCKVDLSSIFGYLDRIASKHSDDLAVPSLGRNIILRLQFDSDLRLQAANEIPDMLAKESLKAFLPSFLKGLINDNTSLYKEKFNELIALYGDGHLTAILYALGVASPNDETCLSLFKPAIDDKKNNHLLTPVEYLNLVSIRNFNSEDVIKFTGELSKNTNDTQELIAILKFLLNNLEESSNELWFRSIAKNVFVIPNNDTVNITNHFVNLLIEKDIPFVYQLISLRFEHIGDNCFLKENWVDLVQNDAELFKVQLTHWLSDGNRNTHKALLKLCTVHQLDGSVFKLSQQVLNNLTSSEKLYIALKIAGFIYSKEHLQSLIFSLVESVKVEEEELLDNLFSLLYNYVIYNYRTTLDTMKVILDDKLLPQHILDFYNALTESYDQYFNQLKLVQDFSELHTDHKLAQHIQFYTQQYFSEQYKDIGKTGLASYFKNSPVHSHRWAIRRESEKMHQVSPLGHFQSSIEFPSGEKLNPIHQETMRRTYQKLSKDAININ